MVTHFNYKTHLKKKLFDRILFYSFRIFNAIFQSIEEVTKKLMHNNYRQVGGANGWIFVFYYCVQRRHSESS
jgi:hypothetical protein